MLARSIYEYFWFGTCVRYLQDATSAWKLGTVKDGEFVLANLNQYFQYLRDLNLHVTQRASRKLEAFFEELKEKDANHVLGDDDAAKLRKFVIDSRKTLEAELPGFTAYIVTPKRLDVNRLLNDIPALFAPGAFEKLPAIARYDYEEAGKCIAFERPTAAAFHLLRGTEAVLREFYCSLVKQQRVTQMWGNIVTDLRKRRKAKPYSDLLNHLDHIRSSFRNPTQHPDRIYDIQEAQDLWSLCADATTRMARALN